MRRIATKWHYWIPGLVISLIAIYFALSQVNGEQIRQGLATARYGYLLPCAALLLLGLGVRAARWRGLLSGAISLPDSFAIVGIAYLTNSLMPLRAGEVVRVYLATRQKPPIPAFTAAGTIVLERLLDALMILLWLSLTVAAGAPIPGEIRAAALVAAPVILLAFIGLVLLAGQRALATRLLTALSSRLPARFDLSIWGQRFLDGLTPLTRPRKLLAALLWTALGWVCTAGAGWALMFAFYDRGDIWVASLFVSAVAFAVALPAVPGNLGTFELAIVTVLTLTRAGEPTGQAVAFAVILHAIDLGVYLLAGLFGLLRLGLSPTALLRREKS